jgi:trimeric autotransporter adhesin
VDFDVTTNGDFVSPSKQLVFPAGSTASQPFIIRVYDDASVEGTESFTLTFSVNAGGGDAAAGTAKTVFTMVIADNDLAPSAGTTPFGSATIGSIAALIGAGPFDATQQSQRSQFQYTAAELNSAGIPSGYISAISLFVQSKASTRPFTSLTIKMGKSTVGDLVNGTVTQGSSMKTVKSVSSYTTASGWNSFALDSAYLWDGTSNLVVEFCFDNGSSQAGAGADQLSAYYDGSGAAQGNMFLQNGINCSQAFSSVSYYGSGRKPVVGFTYGIPETTVATTLNSSTQEWLGPNTDIYFYDQTNNQLMARIQNSSSFDYGCTQVTVDRAGNTASPFWNNTPANYLMDKTFHVIPTNNNPSGNYIITLYYTQAEVTGWQAISGQSINNTQIVKTSNPISSVTPGNPGAGGSLYTGLASVSKIGSNTGLTYNFTTGFSGFGAGIIGTVLPIRLLGFKGAIRDNHAELYWSTSSEENSRGFDIEKSYNGKTFERIGFVAAMGSSSRETYYQFTDKDIAKDSSYYRLKLIDLNDQYQYSNTVFLKNSTANEFQVLTNPFNASIQIRWNRPVSGVAVSRLLDITGKELYINSQELLSSSLLYLDLTDKPISRGIYILDIFINHEHHVQKLIKQ